MSADTLYKYIVIRFLRVFPHPDRGYSYFINRCVDRFGHRRELIAEPAALLHRYTCRFEDGVELLAEPYIPVPKYHGRQLGLPPEEDRQLPRPLSHPVTISTVGDPGYMRSPGADVNEDPHIEPSDSRWWPDVFGEEITCPRRLSVTINELRPGQA